MILYLETSSLVKLYVREADSKEVREWVAAAGIVATSILAYVEARAALARKFREKGFGRAEYRRAKEALEQDWSRFFILKLTDQTVRRAGDLAEKHGLRGFDAAHLAAAMDLSSAAKSGVQFKTADGRLRSVAKREGFETSVLSP